MELVPEFHDPFGPPPTLQQRKNQCIQFYEGANTHLHELHCYRVWGGGLPKLSNEHKALVVQCFLGDDIS